MTNGHNNDSNNKEVKQVSPEEARTWGILQEVNRQFFHPMGLALAVNLDQETGEYTGYSLLDYRDQIDDNTGMIYADLDSDKAMRKHNTVADMQWKYKKNREKKLGWYVQPVEDLSESFDE